MAGPEQITDQESPVFLVTGPEDRQQDAESVWHRRLLGAWLPLIRQLGPAFLLDRPESRLAFHVHKARESGKSPVSIQFMPVHRVYPVNGARVVVATAADHVSAPDWPVGGDVRRRWPRTAPMIDTLLTPLPATEDAFRDAGFRGRTWVIPGPACLEASPTDANTRTEGVEMPFGRVPVVLPEPAWQESDAGARGLSSRAWFGVRRGYYRFARPFIPAGAHHAVLREFQRLKKFLSRRCGGDPWRPVAVNSQDSEVTIARLDPVSDPSGVAECLMAYRRALGDRKDRMLVAEVPGPWEESIAGLVDLARRMPRTKARLVAVAAGTAGARAFRRLAAWALAPSADRASMEWAETMLGLGVPLIAPGRGLSAPVGAGWPGIALAGTRVPAALADDPEGLTCLLALRSRHDELEMAFSRTVSVHSGSRTHASLREAAREASRRASPGFAGEILKLALSARTAGPAAWRAA